MCLSCIYKDLDTILFKRIHLVIIIKVLTIHKALFMFFLFVFYFIKLPLRINEKKIFFLKVHYQIQVLI